MSAVDDTATTGQQEVVQPDMVARAEAARTALAQLDDGLGVLPRNIRLALVGMAGVVAELAALDTTRPAPAPAPAPEGTTPLEMITDDTPPRDAAVLVAADVMFGGAAVTPSQTAAAAAVVDALMANRRVLVELAELVDDPGPDHVRVTMSTAGLLAAYQAMLTTGATVDTVQGRKAWDRHSGELAAIVAAERRKAERRDRGQ